MYPAPSPDEPLSVTYFVQRGWLEILNGLLALACKPRYWEGDPNSDHARQVITRAIQESRVNLYVGAIVSYCGTIPNGVLACDGQAYAKDDYPALWSSLPTALKTATHFNTPDLRARFIYGATVSGDHLSTGGEAEHTLTTAEMPSHAHSAMPHAHATTYPSLSASLEGAGIPLPAVNNPPLPTTTGLADITILANGGGLAHNNLPPFIRLGYGIVAL